jgi:hypothetical protein
VKCNFEMQGLKKNRKKMKKPGAFAVCMHTAKDIWSLCRVHKHGKGARDASLCSWQGCCVHVDFFAVQLDQRRTVKTVSCRAGRRTAAVGHFAERQSG